MKKEKKTLFQFTATFGALFLFAPLLNAQQQDTLPVHKLGEVVVSATRSEQDPNTVGRSITVLSNEQIKNSGANTVAEILSQQEGIYIVGTGQTPGQQQNLFMRGANANQTSIMVDGVRVTDPTGTDNAIDLSELSLANIDRIEIVRGSHSTLYGSSAIGGVINIITKKNSKKGIHSDLDLRAGTFGQGTSTFTENVSMNYAHRSGLYANGEIYNTSTKGLDATIDTVTNPKDYRHLHRDKDGFTKTDAIGKVGYKTEKLDVYASYKFVKQKSDIDAGAYTDDPKYTIAFKRNLYTYGASYKINDKLSIGYVGGSTSMKRVAIDDSSIVDNNGTYNHTCFSGSYIGNTLTNELQANYKNKWLNMIAGGTMFNEKMSFNTYYYSNNFGVYETKQNLDSLKISVNTYSQFIHADINGSLINKKLDVFTLSLGARNTLHSLFGNNITYEINPSLKVNDNGLLYASWSTGFNAPSLYQLYDTDKDPTSHISRGNNTLKPETSTSLEFGFKQKVNDKVSFHISWFRTIVENSIDYVYLWNKKTRTDSLTYSDYRGDTYINIGKQTNQGFEFGMTSKLGDKISINGNISLINGKLNYDPSSIDTSHTHGNHVQLFNNGAFLDKSVESIGLVRRPSTANVNFTYRPIKKLSLTANVRYAGPRGDIYYTSSLGPYGALATKSTSDYTLFDVLVRYTILKGFVAGLRVENMFNVKYNEIYGYTTRGRGFYINMRYAF